jgi:hypothetical protein
MVGGDGGIDSSYVGFRATRGERVTVETPAQQRQGRGGEIHNHYHTHNWNVTATDAKSFNSRATRRQIATNFDAIVSHARLTG